MAERTILTLPKHEKLLRTPSKPVARVGQRTARLIEDLEETLAAAGGIGLAAPQIGVLERVALVTIGLGDDDEEEEAAATPPREPEVIVLINPEILDEEEGVRGYDGCLSIPGLQGYTERPRRMRVRALDRSGESVEYLFEGYDARVAAHEIDHLEGILFLDRLATLEDLYYIVEDEEGVGFLPYTEVHPEVELGDPPRLALPTRGIAGL